MLFQFQLILVLILAHVAHHHLIARLQANNFHKLKVGIAQLHFCVSQSPCRNCVQTVRTPRDPRSRGVGYAHHILSFTAFITYTSVFRPERRRRLLSFVQLYGEGNNTILGQRSDAALTVPSSFSLPILTIALPPACNTVAVRVGYLALYLEVAQIGDDGNLRTFRHLRADLVVYVSEDCLAGERTCASSSVRFCFGKRFSEDAEVQLLYLGYSASSTSFSLAYCCFNCSYSNSATL